MDENLEVIATLICQELGYEYLERVGGGNFKETFHVRNKDNFSEALKVFRSGNSPKRSEREIDAMLQCNHKNIGKLRFVSAFEHDSNNYLFTVEEYLAGGTLSNRLKNGLMDIHEVSVVGHKLIDAINHIASQGLVHRDIKPDNIMFRDKGLSPVIVDFGLVRNLTNESLTHTWLVQGPGSPYFASPEQLNNQKDIIDWRTDQFALGVLLSLCCFGLHPYWQINDNAGDVVTRVAQREPLGEEFLKMVQASGLQSLAKMVAQWPIGRYRTPIDLSIAWNKDTSELR